QSHTVPFTSLPDPRRFPDRSGSSLQQPSPEGPEAAAPSAKETGLRCGILAARIYTLRHPRVETLFLLRHSASPEQNSCQLHLQREGATAHQTWPLFWLKMQKSGDRPKLSCTRTTWLSAGPRRPAYRI
ncbi:hypothetical protein NDU88_007772, partial [Pleurodeles waltl]